MREVIKGSSEIQPFCSRSGDNRLHWHLIPGWCLILKNGAIRPKDFRGVPVMIKLKVWMVFGILVANAVGVNSNGYAADSSKRYAVRGAGAQSCERFVSFFQQKP